MRLPLTMFCLLTMTAIGDPSYAQNINTPAATSLCDMPDQRGTAMYQKYCGVAPTSAATPSGPTPQQQMAMKSAQLGGYMIGQGLHNLFGQPKPLTTPLDPAAQQRALAAEQLNHSGIYLLKKNDYAGAINEFQQALNQAPNDANILFNLQLARQRQKNAADAAKTSNALGNLLGTVQGTLDQAPGAPSNPLNLVNLDPNVVDFRGVGHTSSANPNSSFLNTVITGSDSNTVDMGNSTKNYVDPKLLEGQIKSMLGNPVPVAAQISPQEPEEFIDRWAQHIPDRYQHVVRSFGLFAPRTLAHTSSAIFAILGQKRRNPRSSKRRQSSRSMML
jgi:hypothetical protein